MMRRWIPIVLTILAFGMLIGNGASSNPPAQSGPISVTPTSPLPGSNVSTETPTIAATFSDTGGTIDPATVLLYVDNENVTGVDTVAITQSGVTYAVPPLLKLVNGNHSVTISLSDSSGHSYTYSWQFWVNTSLAGLGNGGAGINTLALVTDIGIGAGVFAVAFAGYYYYLRRTRKFTFRKYFAKHPVNKDYLTLVIPGVAAFLFLIVALDYVLRTPNLPLLTPEYFVVAALFIGLAAYAVESRREKRRIRAYERGFAQFLFEMADAMRGGLDPAKAITELSGTHTDILRKPLRIAADGIKVGRPFDAVLRSMVLPMRSSLITRYAELIADASTVGGETAIVIHRAAKDMDDFIKIEQERNAALTMPVAVLYVAFGVLMAVLFSLLSIAPSLGSVSLSFISGGSNTLSSAGHAAAVGIPKLPSSVLEQRFADLMLINALGTGIIIGVFTEGKAKYGLLHSLALLAITAIAFLFFAP
jgi:pilus assembly protein TadC